MDDCPEGKVEKTAIVLEDDEAAIVLDEHGSIHCHIPTYDNEPERNLKPHELIILAISIKYAADTEGLIKLCSQWLEQYDNDIREIDGIEVRDRMLN